MAKALSKSQLVAAIAEKAELPKKQAAEILDHIAELAYKHAKDTFTLPGIGKLVLNNGFTEKQVEFHAEEIRVSRYV